MRVNRGHLDERQRGVSIAIMGVFLTVLLGSAAFTVDLGQGWMKRRSMVTATDSAALAAAQAYAENTSDGCGVEAPGYLADNVSDAQLQSCQRFDGGNDDGVEYVTVEANRPVDYIFGPIIGFDGIDAYSTTSVQVQGASIVSGGLRPFGICSAFLDGLSPTPEPNNGVQYVIEYGRTDQAGPCSSDVPGNWSVLDFNGGSNPQGEINEWVENGYDGEVVIGEWYEGNPGSYSNAMRTEMRHLRDNVDCFGLPIYDIANDLGGGNAEFQITDFAGMKLIDFKLTGPQENRFFTIEFVDCVLQGSCENPPCPVGNGIKILSICAVLDDAANRCFE